MNYELGKRNPRVAGSGVYGEQKKRMGGNICALATGEFLNSDFFSRKSIILHVLNDIDVLFF